MMDPLEDRRRGVLWGLAIGDALGAAVEFRPPGSFKPVTGFRGGGPHGLNAGEWTDDTSMALALADSIGNGWDLNDQARRYLSWFETGEYSVNGRCFDIGIQTSGALRRFRLTEDASRSGNADDRSSGNGSIMRVAPVPIAFAYLYPDQIEVLAQRGEESSIPTHPSAKCRSACRYLTVLLAALAHGVPRETALQPDWEMLARLGDLEPSVGEVVHGSFRSASPGVIRGSGYVVECLEAALWAFHNASDFETAVLAAVNLGDDADTTGAVCGQLAGAWVGETGIPEVWRREVAKPEMLETAFSALELARERSG